MSHGAVVVIGNFDGVHRGHQAVLEAVRAAATARGLVPRLLTFDPHPAATLGRTAPPLLTRIPRRIELARRTCPGLDVVVREFTPAFAALSPTEFAERVLATELDARVVMVGDNFRFGRGRSGGIEDLRTLGERFGFALASEPLASDAQGPWSSTRVRERLAAGDVAGAAAILGRPHMVSGRVEPGHRRGRTLGFPTCNLPGIAEALPPNGVYAVLVDRVVDGVASALARGVANLGVRPTLVGDPAPLLEVHLFDRADDLYGAELRVHFVRRLREERRFEGLDALRARIACDAAEAREALSGVEPDPRAGGAWA